MRAITRRNLLIVGKGKFFALFVCCILFGVSGRVETTMTYEQHILSLITDHYYLTYAMIPFYLWVCFFVIEDDVEIIVMRYYSYYRYFLSKVASLAVISLLFMAIQLFAVFLSGIGLPKGNTWILFDGTSQSELFSVLSGYFKSPISCFICAALYMLLGLCVSGMFCIWISHYLSKSSATKLLTGFYVITAFSIKVPSLQELPITGFNHWIILHHNLTSEHRFLMTAVTTVCLIVIMIWSVKKHWNWKLTVNTKKKNGLTQYYWREAITQKNLLIIIITMLLLVIWKYLRNRNVTFADVWITELFAGHGTGTFNALAYLEMIIINGVPLYLLAIFIEKVTSSHSIYVSIRVKTRAVLLKSIMKTSLILIALYVLLLTMISLVGIYILSMQTTDQTIPLILVCIGLKLLDILTQFLFMMVIYCLTKQITVGFLALMGLNLLCTLPVGISSYSPFGLSSIARIYLPQTQNGISIFSAFAVLIITSGIISSWLCIYGHKQLLNN